MRQHLALAVAFLLGLTLLTSTAHAYNFVIQTGDVVAPGAFQASLIPQVIANRYDGVNVDAALDVGLDEASSARGLIGVGDGVDFEAGGLYKWIPFPDTERQPAIGGEAGVIFARTKGKSELELRLHPLLSKRFETEVGDFSPYLALPLGFTFRDGTTFVPVQLTLGSELRLLSTPNLSFFLEGAINLHDAFGAVTAAISWRFDDVKLRR